MMKTILTIFAAAAMTATAAGAVTVNDVTGDSTYADANPVSPGVYGVEIRSGNGATNGDWEIGVGTQTSNSGMFSQSQFAWPGDTKVSFTLDWGSSVADRVSVSIDGTTVSYDFDTLDFGNTLRMQGKRDAYVEIGSINDHDVSASGFSAGLMPESWTVGGSSGSPEDVLLSGSVFESAFTLTGFIAVESGAGVSGSTNGVQFTVGNTDMAPIPLPAAAWMLLAGVGGLFAVGRRRVKPA